MEKSSEKKKNKIGFIKNTYKPGNVFFKRKIQLDQNNIEPAITSFEKAF